jgi:hypothetical protein
VKASDESAIHAHVSPLIGRPAWRVRVGYGSFLTMEFGEPIWQALGRTEEMMVRGEWHLWIKHAAWRLEDDRVVLAGSADDRGALGLAVERLEGLVLRDVTVSGPALDTVFVFEGRLVLRVLADTTESEHWLLFVPDGNVLVVGPGACTYERADAPPARSELDAPTSPGVRATRVRAGPPEPDGARPLPRPDRGDPDRRERSVGHRCHLGRCRSAAEAGPPMPRRARRTVFTPKRIGRPAERPPPGVTGVT